MNFNNFKDRITLYLDGELNKQDKIEFENSMSKNKDWNQVVLDIRKNNKHLKNLTKISTKNNFILRLNNKIDTLESKNSTSLYSLIKESIYNLKPVPALSIFSLALVISFSVFKINNFSITQSLSKSDEANIDNYIAINDSDTLNVQNDSLNHPILLIGNDR